MRSLFFLLPFLLGIISQSHGKGPRPLPSSFFDPSSFVYMRDLVFNPLPDGLRHQGNCFVFEERPARVERRVIEGLDSDIVVVEMSDLLEGTKEVVAAEAVGFSDVRPLASELDKASEGGDDLFFRYDYLEYPFLFSREKGAGFLRKPMVPTEENHGSESKKEEIVLKAVDGDFEFLRNLVSQEDRHWYSYLLESISNLPLLSHYIAEIDNKISRLDRDFDLSKAFPPPKAFSHPEVFCQSAERNRKLKEKLLYFKEKLIEKRDRIELKEPLAESVLVSKEERDESLTLSLGDRVKSETEMFLMVEHCGGGSCLASDSSATDSVATVMDSDALSALMLFPDSNFGRRFIQDLQQRARSVSEPSMFEKVTQEIEEELDFLEGNKDSVYGGHEHYRLLQAALSLLQRSAFRILKEKIFPQRELVEIEAAEKVERVIPRAPRSPGPTYYSFPPQQMRMQEAGSKAKKAKDMRGSGAKGAVKDGSHPSVFFPY